MAAQMRELPKSLQLMIADCRKAITNWDPEEDADDPIMQSMRHWTLRLSRGEFEVHLYWECVAEDCEEAGDWDGALSGYRQILDTPNLHGMEYSKAYSAMGAVHAVLGDNEAALECYKLASAKSEDDSRILWRFRIVNEVSQLLRIGLIRRARKLIRRGLAAYQGEVVDHLGTARLLIASAKCELADSKPAKAAQSLRQAWERLNALVQSYGDANESLRHATGIHFAYATWWSTEAKRRRVAREGNSEIDALERAIEEARLCFDPGGWRRPWHDLTLMNLLLQIADDYDRHGMLADAATSRNEAEEIVTKRRFPESAKWPRCDDRQPTRFGFLRNWRGIFRRWSKCTGDGKAPQPR